MTKNKLDAVDATKTPLEILGQAVPDSMEPTHKTPSPELGNHATQAAVKAYWGTLTRLERLGSAVAGAYERRDGRRATISGPLGWYKREPESVMSA